MQHKVAKLHRVFLHDSGSLDGRATGFVSPVAERLHASDTSITMFSRCLPAVARAEGERCLPVEAVCLVTLRPKAAEPPQRRPRLSPV
jgi:hypothetical protein